MRILIIESEQPLAAAMTEALKSRGIHSDVAGGAEDARQMVEVAHYAAILLDPGLSNGKGLDLIRWLRAHNNPIPVIAVSAQGALGSKITVLNSGADDYILKPFDVDELSARLHAVIRRQGSLSGSSFSVGNLRFDTISGDLMVGNRAVKTSAVWQSGPCQLRPRCSRTGAA